MSRKGRKINTILALIMLVFIWGQSMIPASASTAESEFFLSFVDEFMDVGVEYLQGGQVYNFLMDLAGRVGNDQARAFLQRCVNYLQTYYFSRDAGFWIRKVAHFSEYALFGVLMCMLFSRPNGRGRFWWPELMCLCVAAIDESIQLITPGREGKLRDVTLDMMGATAGILFAMVVLAVIWRPGRRNVGKNVQ